MKRIYKALLGLLAVAAISLAIFGIRALAGENNREMWDYFAQIIPLRTTQTSVFEPNTGMGVRITSVTASIPFTPGDSTRNYVYVSSDVAVVANITLTGTGNSFVVAASTGPVTFNINGGQSVNLLAGQSLGSTFKDKITNPSVHVTSLGAGAVAKVFIDGGL